jgi:hypothetical protein
LENLALAFKKRYAAEHGFSPCSSIVNGIHRKFPKRLKKYPGRATLRNGSSKAKYSNFSMKSLEMSF